MPPSNGEPSTEGRDRSSRAAWLALAAAGIVAAVVAGRAKTRGAEPISHVSERERDYEAAAHRILILGAGFGGLTTALELDRRLASRDDVSVLVVDRDTALLFTPLLWTVADGRADPSDVVVPIRSFQRGRRFHLLPTDIEGIDLDRREVATTAGTRPYDVLVVALGSITAIPDLPGLREHARVFLSPLDALELRNHLIAAAEEAHRSDDPAERRAWLTFVVGGGGDTGVELAATIRTYLSTGLLAAYPWLSADQPRVVVVGRADRLVPMSDRATSDAVRRELEADDIEVLTGASIEWVTDREVGTSAETIPARTLFWAAGITAPPVVRALPIEHAKNGSVIVDDHLRVPARPEVYVVGDAAWAFDAADQSPVPPTAQAAEHAARYVAEAIVASLEGREVPPFRFRPKGHLALLGRRSGVGRIGPFTVTGLPAWLLWHAYYLSHIPSWRNRLRLLSDWLLSAAGGRETAPLRLNAPAAEPR